MPGNKRSKKGTRTQGRRRTSDEIDAHRAQIARWIITGVDYPVTRREMSKELGISVATVQNDIDALRSIWDKAIKVEPEEIRARLVAEWDLLRQTHWQAWERSQKPKTTRRVDRKRERPDQVVHIKTGRKTDQAGKKLAQDLVNALKEAEPVVVEEKRTKTVRESDGDPRFLSGVADALQALAELQGVGADGPRDTGKARSIAEAIRENRKKFGESLNRFDEQFEGPGISEPGEVEE